MTERISSWLVSAVCAIALGGRCRVRVRGRECIGLQSGGPLHGAPCGEVDEQEIRREQRTMASAVLRNNRFYKKKCPTREAIGQKESANAHENKFERKRNW